MPLTLCIERYISYVVYEAVLISYPARCVEHALCPGHALSRASGWSTERIHKMPASLELTACKVGDRWKWHDENTVRSAVGESKPAGMDGECWVGAGWEGMRSLVVLFFFLNFFFQRFYLFLGQRQSMNGGGPEREGDTESETGSRLRAISPEPDVGLELTDREIVTWLKSDA